MVPLHTHFATVAPCAATDLIAAIKSRHVEEALQGTVWEGLPVLGSAAPFRLGGRSGPDNYTDIAAGVFRMRNVSELYLYPNSLVAVVLTGAQLADWLERSASIFRQFRPGDRDMPLQDDRVPGFAFETIPALTYAIDLTRPARLDVRGRLADPQSRRIVGLSYENRPIDPEQRFVLATNNHRFNLEILGGGAEGLSLALNAGTRIQGLIADHVRKAGVVGQPARRNWHFLPMPGTTALLQAGPGAAQYLAEIAAFRPQDLGTDAAGFTHYRLHL